MNFITTSIRVEVLNVDSQADTLIHERLMRPQMAAMRSAYNLLLDHTAEKSIYHTLRTTFPLLTGRNVNDAILSAKAVLSSQRERLPEQIATLSRRIKQTEDRLTRESNKQTELRLERIQGLEKRLQRLQDRQEILETHLANGTVPPALFGGQRLWEKVTRRTPGAQEEWRERRTDQFLSRGSAQYAGNPHCRLVVDANGSLQLSIRIPDEMTTRGNKGTTTCIWPTFELSYSRQYEPLLRNAAEQGAAKLDQYTVRLLRLEPGRYRAYITVAEPVAHREYRGTEPLPDGCDKIGGIDLNLDHLAVTVTDTQGQFRGYTTFKFANLGELPRRKTQWQVGNIARDVIQWLQEQGSQAIILEDLNIARRETGSARFNRRTVPFAYRQLAKALTRRALRKGLVVKRINPAYTSWIGRLKYARMYGLSIHAAAAYVIARRGLDLQERIPADLIKKFPALVALLKQETAKLERKQTEEKRGDESKSLKSKLNQYHEWIQRLENWKSCSPEAGRPWLLWVTLYLVDKNVSGARNVLTDGRN